MTTALTPLPTEAYRDLVRRALAEDIGGGDITTQATIGPDQQARAVVLAKSHCVVAGLEVMFEAFRQTDPGVRIVTHRPDGSRCSPGDEVAEIRGRAAALLTAERTALNYLQRLTGVATLTHAFVEAAAGRIIVLDTRKTTPLMRTLEKYAVRRRRHQPSFRAERRHPDQGQPCAAGLRRCAGHRAYAGRRTWPAYRSRGTGSRPG